jgi:hypothetical protein
VRLRKVSLQEFPLIHSLPIDLIDGKELLRITILHIRGVHIGLRRKFIRINIPARDHVRIYVLPSLAGLGRRRQLLHRRLFNIRTPSHEVRGDIILGGRLSRKNKPDRYLERI